MNGEMLWVKLIAMTAAIITFAYANFETKDHSREVLDHVIRIEKKLDTLIINENQKRK